MVRVSKTCPFSGTRPHREHRTEKNRKKYKYNGFVKRLKTKKEKLKLKELEL